MTNDNLLNPVALVVCMEHVGTQGNGATVTVSVAACPMKYLLMKESCWRRIIYQ